MGNKLPAWRKLRASPGLIKIAIVFSLLLGVLLPFYPLLLGTDQALLYRDLSNSFLPSKAFFWDSWRLEGRMPLWNPFPDGGIAYLGELTAAPLHPGNFLLLLFPRALLPWAFSLWVVMHYSILASGFYYLVRAQEINKKISLICAFGLTWSGPILSAFCLPHTLGGFSFAPWFFAFLLKNKKTGHIIYLYAASLALALSFLCGDPQQTYLCILLMPFFLFFTKKNLWKYFFTGGLTFLLILPQLIPAYQQMQLSIRGQSGEAGISPSLRYAFSFHPKRLLEWAWPQLHGSLESPANFSGQQLTNTNMWGFFIWDAHLGYFIFFVFLISLLLLKKSELKKGLYLAILAFFSLWLAIGNHLPISLYQIFDYLLPAWQRFRYPERLLPWCVFFLHLLAARLMTSLFQARLENDKKSRELFLAACIFLLLLQGLWIGRKGILFTPIAAVEPSSVVQKILASQKKMGRQEGSRVFSLQPFTPTKKEIQDGYNGQIKAQWESLAGNISSYYRIPDSSGYFTLRNSDKARLLAVVKPASILRWGEIMGSRYFLFAEGEKKEVRVNPQNIPLFSLPSSWQEMQGDMEMLNEILRNKKPLAQLALFAGSNHKTHNFAPAALKEQSYQTANRNLEIEAPQGARLLWNETFDPGWSAYLDGHYVAIEKANTWAMSVEIPPRKEPWRLELRFNRSYFGVSLLGALFWLLLFLYSLARGYKIRAHT